MGVLAFGGGCTPFPDVLISNPLGVPFENHNLFDPPCLHFACTLTSLFRFLVPAVCEDRWKPYYFTVLHSASGLGGGLRGLQSFGTMSPLGAWVPGSR